MPELGGKNAIPSCGRKRIFAFKTVQPLCQNALPRNPSYILPNRLRHLRGDIHYPNGWFCNGFFSCHICDQRKEAKERRLIKQIFYAVMIRRLLIAIIFLCDFRYSHTKISSAIDNNFNGFFKIVCTTANEQVAYKTYLQKRFYGFFGIVITMGN